MKHLPGEVHPPPVIIIDRPLNKWMQHKSGCCNEHVSGMMFLKKKKEREIT